tara:strand:+ start:26 stop:634 length:609 start_codon:yes stop_codon:yes gene_type:complete
MNKEFLGILVIKLLIAILLITTYLYIEKLEKTGCECAKHENKDFIKNFSLFAFVYYIITLLINPSSINMNSSVTMLYLVVELIFLVTIIFYFYYTLNYVRYLINEKCKCSEDMRREFIMWGSIIELFLIVIVFLNAMLLPVLSNCSVSVLDNVSNTKKGLKSVLSDPISNLKNSPKNISKSIKNIYKTSKTTFKKMNDNLKK